MMTVKDYFGFSSEINKENSDNDAVDNNENDTKIYDSKDDDKKMRLKITFLFRLYYVLKSVLI